MIFDVETHLIDLGRGADAPRIVCMQWGTQDAPFIEAPPTKDRARAILAGPVEGQNLQFDMGCVGNTWPDLIGATLEGQRYCTRIAARLADIQAGYSPFKQRYSLEALVLRYFDLDISEAKGDPNSWRLRYRELDGVPLEQWPPGARSYALDDVVLEHRCVEHQAREMPVQALAHVPRMTLASIALQHSALRGVRLDLALLRRIDDAAREHLERAQNTMALAGLASRDNKGKFKTSTKALRLLVAEAYAARGEQAPHTPPSDRFPLGQIKADSDTLIASGHPVAMAWGIAAGARKVVEGYTSKWLESRRDRLHPAYDLPKETGRTSCYSPNLQQLPRPTHENAEHGALLRQCLVPEPGHVFVWADYDQIELCAIAQLCLWRRHGDTLARDINEGNDVHNRVGGMLIDVDFASFDKENPEHAEARQHAKAVNYGRPGGLGHVGLRKVAAAQGHVFSEAKARALIAAHAAAYPDVDTYVREGIHTWKFRDAFARIPHPDLPDMLRLCAKPTQACNTPFQGLVAAGALAAFVELWRIAAADGDWWPCLFVHDEIVCQAPVARAQYVQHVLERVMVAEMVRHIPDVHIGVQGKVRERWTKKAPKAREVGQ